MTLFERVMNEQEANKLLREVPSLRADVALRTVELARELAEAYPMSDKMHALRLGRAVRGPIR